MQIFHWLIAAAVIFLLLCIYTVRHRRYLRAFFSLLFFVLAAFGAYAVYQFSSGMHSYQPIYLERDIAEIRILPASQGMEVIVRDLVNGHNYRWNADGREWSISVRKLHLTGLCALFGWPDHYRLARMQIHTPGGDGQKANIHNVQLQQEQQGWDPWQETRRLLEKRPDLAGEIGACIEAGIMESDKHPLPENGRFRASIVSEGLHIRAIAGRIN